MGRGGVRITPLRPSLGTTGRTMSNQTTGFLKDLLGGGLGDLIGGVLGGPLGSAVGGLADDILGNAGQKGEAIRKGLQTPTVRPSVRQVTPPGYTQPYMPSFPQPTPSVPNFPQPTPSVPNFPQPAAPQPVVRIPSADQRAQRVQRVERVQRASERRTLTRARVRSITTELKRGLRRLTLEELDTVMEFFYEVQEAQDPTLLEEALDVIETLQERAILREQIAEAASAQRRTAKRRTAGVIEPIRTTGSYTLRTGTTANQGCARGTCTPTGYGMIQ